MPYVERDRNGNVTAVYARPQPGYATEHLPDNAPSVVALRSRVVSVGPPAAPPAGCSTDDLRQALIDAGIFTEEK